MPAHLVDSWTASIHEIEKITRKKFGVSDVPAPDSIPLLVSVRSGTAVDMPRYHHQI